MSTVESPPDNTPAAAALNDPVQLASLQNRLMNSMGNPGAVASDISTSSALTNATGDSAIASSGLGKQKEGAGKAKTSGKGGPVIGEGDEDTEIVEFDSQDWFAELGLESQLRGRMHALRKLQSEQAYVEAEFFKALYVLEYQFAERFSQINLHRHALLTGKEDPTAEEANWAPPNESKPSSDDNKKDAAATDSTSDSLAKALKDKVNIHDDAKLSSEGKGQSVPGFWLRIFKNVPLLADMVQPHDEDLLNLLQDIRVVMNPSENPGFRLEFLFATNDFFTNDMLTKDYRMRMDPQPNDIFAYEGPEIIECTGCTINWNKGKNLTVKSIKKVQKHKNKQQKRTITKEVKQDSFFNFFDPPKAPPQDQEDVDDELEALLSADFEIGHFIRERVVPRALLYFTGEAVEDVDDEFGDEEEDDDLEGDEDDDEALDDEEDSGDAPSPPRPSKGRSKH